MATITLENGSPAQAVSSWTVTADGSDFSLEAGFTPSRCEVINTTDDDVWVKTPGMVLAETLHMDTASITMVTGSIILFETTGSEPDKQQSITVAGAAGGASDILVITACR